MKKIITILLACMSIIYLLACGDENKKLELTLDEANSKEGQITADLTLTDLVGEYTIYYGDINKQIDSKNGPIMTVTGGETVHFEKLIIPAGCFSLIIANEKGERYTATIPMDYCSLPDEEF